MPLFYYYIELDLFSLDLSKEKGALLDGPNEEKMFVFVRVYKSCTKNHKNLVYPLYFVLILCYTMDCKIKRLQNKVGVK